MREMKPSLSEIAKAYQLPLYAVSRYRKRGLPLDDPPRLVEALASQTAGRLPELVSRIAANPAALDQITIAVSSISNRPIK